MQFRSKNIIKYKLQLICLNYDGIEGHFGQNVCGPPACRLLGSSFGRHTCEIQNQPEERREREGNSFSLQKERKGERYTTTRAFDSGNSSNSNSRTISKEYP